VRRLQIAIYLQFQESAYGTPSSLGHGASRGCASGGREMQRHMNLFTRFFEPKHKPSFGRRLLQTFLPSLGPRDRLTHDGEGKRLLPPEGTENHVHRFVSSCILNVQINYVPAELGKLGVGRLPAVEQYDLDDVDGYRTRLLLGIALIDAVRANNAQDDAALGEVLDGWPGVMEVQEKYSLKEGSSNAALYATLVKTLDESDLY
jgi:hypothetical protein